MFKDSLIIFLLVFAIPCLGDDFPRGAKNKAEQADWQLDRAYKNLLFILNGDREKAALLKNSQEAWLKFRELNCQLVESMHSREGESAKIDCLYILTDDRLMDINSMTNPYK